METLIFALSPIAVVLLTQGIKKLQTIELSDHRVALVRVVTVVLSFIVVVLGAWLNGEEVDPVTLQTFVETIVTFIVSTVVYLMGKKIAQ